MSLECSSCERDARAGHAPDCKFATVSDLRAEIARLTAEAPAPAAQRDPGRNPKPGDQLRGPMVECKVLHIIVGEHGTEAVEFVVRSTDPRYPRWSEPSKRTIEDWRRFVDCPGAEVIHAAA